MFGGLAPVAHGPRVLVEALLYGVQHMLMLPARDPPLLAGRAARLECTVAARIGPIAPQLLPVFLVRAVILQLFACRTAIHIFVAEIDEVLLAETTPCLNARGKVERRRAQLEKSVARKTDGRMVAVSREQCVAMAGTVELPFEGGRRPQTPKSMK
jgi:hypothetical protein